ncbi:uncharacterized protein LOC112461013 [Temnothorax curvispinosus]|uniref:Uncharacterized protein LOC112461013 n=1 Tax=Temnothorax curvispinosus TaxID=300111 RepID=A0A6J1QL83_9HYME|nr:uncharacterized protein LOC112461013 [Temnothorax curvispinosus]
MGIRWRMNVGCTTLEGVGRKRIGESLGSCVPFMQFSPLTPSNCGHHVRDILSLDESKMKITDQKRTEESLGPLQSDRRHGEKREKRSSGRPRESIAFSTHSDRYPDPLVLSRANHTTYM